LPDSARVWVYQASKPFSKEQHQILSTALSTFLQQWTAHGKSLSAGFDLLYDHFIAIGLDESQSGASGCSIDALFRAIQREGATTGIDFFNRELTAFKINDKVSLVPKQQLKEKLNELGPGAVVFNNLISTKEEFKNSWLVPAASTWLKRYIAPISV
jgi:hypothetical protein